MGCLQSLKLRRTSSFDRTWEENVAESVANELVLKAQNSGGGASTTSKTGPAAKSGRSATQVAKPNEEKKPRRLREFRNIKISQVGRHVWLHILCYNLSQLLKHLNNYYYYVTGRAISDI